MNGSIFSNDTMERRISLIAGQRALLVRTILPLVLWTFLSASLLRAEDLTLTDGTVYKNITVTKVDPDGLRIIHSDGGGKVLFTQLPEATQQKYHYDPAAAQKFAAAQEAKKRADLERALKQSSEAAAAEAANPTPKAAASTTTEPEKKIWARTIPDKILQMVKGDLVFLDGNKFSNFDEQKLAPVRYYAIYYSASWCGPCREFTPQLIKFYNEFKPEHPSFELIFVSSDRDESGMLQYMRADTMTWPAVRFSAIPRNSEGKRMRSGISQYAGNGIPDLVLVDAMDGSVMSDSYNGQEYLGPHKVMNDIPKMVK